MAKCAVIEYLFGVSLCVCVVVIALVWIFGFQMNGDFGFQMNGGWMGIYTLQTWVDVKMGFDMSLCFIV